MLVLLLVHLVLGAVIIGVGDRLGRGAFALAALGPAATVAWSLAVAGDVLDGRPAIDEIGWVDRLGLRMSTAVDGFGLTMIWLIAGIGVLICLYALQYFSHPKPGTARLAGLMTLFAGAMTGLVAADHVIFMFLCWEATSVVSYLLIGNQDTDPRARAAALQALVITGGGGLALLAGLIILGAEAGTASLSGIVAAGASGALDGNGVVVAGLVCVLVGAFTKSAQVPFGSWLPGAMVAPTPVSAYLHSATMVKAGVYLIARLAPGFAAVGPWRVLCVVAGLTTMVVGALRALKQSDLKLLLAMGTVSQLGFLVALFGLGIPAVTKAGVVMLVAHALFKSALFMVVGLVDHEYGTRDVRLLPSLWGVMSPVVVVGVLSAASMAGLPVMFGFVAKETVIDGLLEYRSDVVGGLAILVVVLIASAGTLAYSARFVLGLVGAFTHPPSGLAVAEPHHPRTPWAFLAPAAALTALTVVLGVVPGIVDEPVEAAVGSLLQRGYDVHLALWHGFNVPLLLSAIVIVVGVLLVAARSTVARVQRVPVRLPSSERGYLGFLKGLNVVADRVTSVVQSGSLPIYAGIILATAAVLPTVALLTGSGWQGLTGWLDLPVHLPITALMVASAIGTAMARRRFAAALLLGIVGYGIAGLYVAQGAPDLALTQFSIETLSVVLFVLVLRFLPDELTARTSPPVQVMRMAVSAVVGVFVFVMAMTMSQVRTQAPVSDDHILSAVPDGKGNNVVNVIIVDFRGLDTLGEITVLLVAALGAVGIARFRHRPSPTDPHGSDVTDDVVEVVAS